MPIQGNVYCPHIIIITEVLPKCPNITVSSSQLAISGYSMFLNFDPDAVSSYASGICGVAIYVSEGLNVFEIDFPNCNIPDCVCVYLRLRHSDSLFIGCIYWNPSSSLQPSTNLLCDLCQGSTFSHLLLCGDFNYLSVDYSSGSALSSSSSPIQTFIDILNDLFLSVRLLDIVLDLLLIF